MRRLLLVPVLLLIIPLAGVVALILDRDPATAPEDETALPSANATAVPTPTPEPTPVPAPLTLNDIFPPRDISSLDPSRLRTVIATGDVIPARWTDRQIRQRGNDFFYPLSATADIIAAADLTAINLEAPLVEGCPPQEAGTFTFCGLPGFAGALQQAGIDVVTLENNHIGNWGMQGFQETVQHLEAAGLQWADRQTATIVDVRGLKFGFLAFNAVLEQVDRQAMATQIKALRPQVDVLAIAVHWGAEYVSVPATAPGVADDDPVELAHLMVDSGADWVIGNHPHWVQAVEVYKGKFIAYAHGNYIFDQMWSYETRVGVIGKYTFYDDRLVQVEYIPTLIDNYAQPIPMSGPDAQAVLDGMRAASEQLAAEVASGVR